MSVWWMETSENQTKPNYSWHYCNYIIAQVGWLAGTQVRLARGKQKSDSDDLDPTLDPVPQQCVRKTFSASFVPQPAENNT
jgi:hypothetical protein